MLICKEDPNEEEDEEGCRDEMDCSNSKNDDFL
jgi:hypothetical protein